jgi:hypothetical protein
MMIAKDGRDDDDDTVKQQDSSAATTTTTNKGRRRRCWWWLMWCGVVWIVLDDRMFLICRQCIYGGEPLSTPPILIIGWHVLERIVGETVDDVPQHADIQKHM